MYTVRFVGDVTSSELKEAFLQVANERKLVTRGKKYFDDVNADESHAVIDWNEPVHLPTLAQAKDLARTLQKAIPGSAWQVAEVEREGPALG